MLFRQGNDEFLVLRPTPSKLEMLEELLEKVLQNNQDIGELSKALGLDNESGGDTADAKKEE